MKKKSTQIINIITMKNLLLVVLLLSNSFLFSQSIKELTLGEVPKGELIESSNELKPIRLTFGGFNGVLGAYLLNDGRSWAITFSSMDYISRYEFLNIKKAIENNYDIVFKRIYIDERYEYNYEIDKNEQRYLLTATEYSYDNERFSFIFGIMDLPLLLISAKEDEMKLISDF